MSIEIPDWVVEAAAKAFFEDQCPLDHWDAPMEGDERDDWRDGARKVLRAVLEGWLEPAGFQHRYNRPLPDGTSCRWFESSDSDLEKIRNNYSDQYDLRTLYTLRKDKTP